MLLFEDFGSGVGAVLLVVAATAADRFFVDIASKMTSTLLREFACEPSSTSPLSLSTWQKTSSSSCVSCLCRDHTKRPREPAWHGRVFLSRRRSTSQISVSTILFAFLTDFNSRDITKESTGRYANSPWYPIRVALRFYSHKTQMSVDNHTDSIYLW